MSYIQISDESVRERLTRAAQQMADTTPLARDLERVLVSQSLQNFHANGRPAWAGLSPVTLELYRQRGITPQGILQRSPGGLRDSVQGDHGKDFAMVGAGSGKSKDYAAIHQWGGMAAAYSTRRTRRSPCPWIRQRTPSMGTVQGSAPKSMRWGPGSPRAIRRPLPSG